MEISKTRSFFQDISSRELNGFRVRKRPYSGNELSKFTQIGEVAIEHRGTDSPPMGISFCKTSRYSHIIAVSDEEGYISLYNTRMKTGSTSTCRETAGKAKVREWVAHENAIFDVCWIKDDSNILTASGDQSIKVWDTQESKCISVLMGHTGSVKSLSSHSTNPDLIVSGSRDGTIALWDLRCSTERNGMHLVVSTAEIRGAHTSPVKKRTKRPKAASKSITSVLYLKDELSIASAGAVDSVVKFWDIRNLNRPVVQACPNPEPSKEKEQRLHGISSLSQDINGVLISASCMDNRIYLYNVLQLENGPVKSFSGCRIESFFVKSALSPDAAHILSGSSDGNAYVWQVNKPHADPFLLAHDGEVTAVDWCPSEVGKIATSSDDFTVRFWSIQDSCYSNTRSPSSIRRRIMAPPTMERKRLFIEEESNSLKDVSKSLFSEPIHQNNLPNSTTCEFGTPKSQEKRNPLLSDAQEMSEKTPEATLKSNPLLSDAQEMSEKTPEATLKSPSSVLNPPPSLKRRTIKDYFRTS